MSTQKIPIDKATDGQLRKYGEEILGLEFPLAARTSDMLAKIRTVDDSGLVVVEADEIMRGPEDEEDEDGDEQDPEPAREEPDAPAPMTFAEKARASAAPKAAPAAAPAAPPRPPVEKQRWSQPPMFIDRVRPKGGAGPAYKSDPPIVIMISKQDEPGGDRDVPIGCNGVVMLVPRAQLVTIPYRYFDVLQHTVKRIITQDQNTNEIVREVKSYPYEVKWQPPAAEVERWRLLDEGPNLAAA